MAEEMARPEETRRPACDGFERFTVSLIVVRGPCEGEEHVVDRRRWLIGRGPDVDATFDDPAMSRLHSAIEFERGRFHVSDLDSTNGTEVNGTGVIRSELCHGDRIRLGGHVLQILIERKEDVPAYVLSEDRQLS